MNHNDKGQSPIIKGLKYLQRFFAIEFESVSHAEKLVASIGGMLGITLICIISYQITGEKGATLIVPSMGASAVLLFAVPHGKLSQPWALIGGHVVSAIMGVLSYKIVADPFIAAGVAVGSAIGAMHILNCIHPPGGATALAAVIGGPAIHNLGFSYAAAPILLNVSVIFVTAIIFNSLFPWRRYPAAVMMRFTEKPAADSPARAHIVDKPVIEQALADMDIVLDVTTEDLQRLIQLSLEHAQKTRLTAADIKLNHYYTNGKHGAEWSVRRIIDESASDDPQKDMVIYRIVEGHGFNTAHSCTREAFANWAAREVFPNS